MARLGKAVDLIDEASSLVRGSQVISSDLVAKAIEEAGSFNKQAGHVVFFCSLYIIYMASFLPPKTWGRFPEENHFFSNRWFD